MTTAVSVGCARAAGGWRCTVRVGEDPGATRHEVEVADEVIARLRPAAETPDELVRDSFRFLLAREPRESILSRFELPVIARYFPEWEDEIQQPA